MLEKDLNRIIVRSFNKDENSWAYKISDDAQQFSGTVQKPFDYFGIHNGLIFYGESKLVKGLYSFNFKRLEDHQIATLSCISNLAKKQNNNSILPLVSVGFWKSHTFFNVVFIHIDAILKQIANSVFSIKKKSIICIFDRGMCLSIKKNAFSELENFRSKIIFDLDEYLK